VPRGEELGEVVAVRRRKCARAVSDDESYNIARDGRGRAEPYQRQIFWNFVLFKL